MPVARAFHPRKVHRVSTPAGALTSDAVRALEPALHAYARRAISDRELARDLVQETLLAAVQQPERFEGRSTLRTWLIGILSHKVIDHYRRSRPSALDVPADEDPDLLAHPSLPALEQVLDDKAAVRKVERALPTLPELERMAFLLVDVEGVERDAACIALAVNATHLRVLLHRARHRLRRALEHVALPARP
jgi:RNA polymerase sigma-70 factor (ECF subfamily)